MPSLAKIYVYSMPDASKTKPRPPCGETKGSTPLLCKVLFGVPRNWDIALRWQTLTPRAGAAEDPAVLPRMSHFANLSNEVGISSRDRTGVIIIAMAITTTTRSENPPYAKS